MTDVCVPNNRVQRTFQLLLNGLANFQLESNSLWSWAVVFIICAVTLEFFLDDVLAELEVSELKAKLRKEERKRERVERNGDEVEVKLESKKLDCERVERNGDEVEMCSNSKAARGTADT
eukprot:GHVQ01033072.1.p1 GENE.GHVQ01033072.1~~GHVQ01033072.1.p1  ORF type:complete len:120 (+),score=14.13 GHVQ01033072.1:220-579(+)